MNWSFCITTDGRHDGHLAKVIESIQRQNIPRAEHEIIVIGNTALATPGNLHVIPFDEATAPASDHGGGWITRKKNILAREARFENLVVSHDYLALADNWHRSFQEFGSDWDVCVPVVKLMNGDRWFDWVEEGPRWIDYGDNSKIRTTQYVSGGWYAVKRGFAIAHPLNEELVWAQCEDVEWARRCRPFWNLKINIGTHVQAVKPK